MAIGLWSGVSGLGVALGPLVGGAVIEGISWHWIFWLNVPVGLVLVPLAARMLEESHGPAAARPSRRGARLAGLLGVVYGVIRGNPAGWGSLEVVASIARRRRAAGGLRRLGAADAATRCCRCASSAPAPSPPRTACRWP